MCFVHMCVNNKRSAVCVCMCWLSACTFSVQKQALKHVYTCVCFVHTTTLYPVLLWPWSALYRSIYNSVFAEMVMSALWVHLSVTLMCLWCVHLGMVSVSLFVLNLPFFGGGCHCVTVRVYHVALYDSPACGIVKSHTRVHGGLCRSFANILQWQPCLPSKKRKIRNRGGRYWRTRLRMAEKGEMSYTPHIRIFKAKAIKRNTVKIWRQCQRGRGRLHESKGHNWATQLSL